MFYTCTNVIENTGNSCQISDKRYIYILLVNYPDTFSTIFRVVSRCKYNHSSIGISDSNGTFYSYVKTGFRRELPQQHPKFKHREVPCSLYRVEVSDDIYKSAKSILEDHEKQAHKFKYNTLGVILCLLKISYMRKNRYFCSQFVSEILEQMTIIPLAKHSSLYLPDDFTKMNGLELCFSGYLSQLVSQPNPFEFQPCSI